MRLHVIGVKSIPMLRLTIAEKVFSYFERWNFAMKSINIILKMSVFCALTATVTAEVLYDQLASDSGVYEGDYSAKITWETVYAFGDDAGIDIWGSFIEVEKGTEYTFSFYARRGNDGNPDFLLYRSAEFEDTEGNTWLGDGPNQIVGFPDNDDFAEQTYTFTTAGTQGSGTHYINFRINPQDTPREGSTFIIDSVSLKKTGDPTELFPNGDFENWPSVGEFDDTPGSEAGLQAPWNMFATANVDITLTRVVKESAQLEVENWAVYE